MASRMYEWLELEWSAKDFWQEDNKAWSGHSHVTRKTINELSTSLPSFAFAIMFPWTVHFLGTGLRNSWSHRRKVNHYVRRKGLKRRQTLAKTPCKSLQEGGESKMFKYWASLKSMRRHLCNNKLADKKECFSNKETGSDRESDNSDGGNDNTYGFNKTVRHISAGRHLEYVVRWCWSSRETNTTKLHYHMPLLFIHDYGRQFNKIRKWKNVSKVSKDSLKHISPRLPPFSRFITFTIFTTLCNGNLERSNGCLSLHRMAYYGYYCGGRSKIAPTTTRKDTT